MRGVLLGGRLPGAGRSAAVKMQELAAAEMKMVIPIVKVLGMEAADMGPRRL